MLAHRLRRWSSIATALDQYIVFAVYLGPRAPNSRKQNDARKRIVKQTSCAPTTSQIYDCASDSRKHTRVEFASQMSRKFPTAEEEV